MPVCGISVRVSVCFPAPPPGHRGLLPLVWPDDFSQRSIQLRHTHGSSSVTPVEGNGAGGESV